jgi:hypothetical protein
MKQSSNKYIPYAPLKMDRRVWPDRRLTHAPFGAAWISGTEIRR